MRRIASIFSSKQATIRSAATTLMVMVLLSRVLGLIRDRLLAARFDPEILGVYFAAFRIPNLIFELLVMGTLTSAFIPVFTRYITKEKQEESWVLSSSVIHITVIFFFLCSLPMIFFTSTLSKMIAPGFSSEQIALMSQFTQFMIIFQVTPLIIGNFFTGILQSYSLFLAPAAAPVVYNIGIIIGIVFLSPIVGIWAPVYGVGIGALLFICIQIPSLIAIGYRHVPVINMKHTGVREVGKLMGPRTLGLAVSQIDTTIDLILSTLLGARMVTIFQFAQHLQQLPIGLFGTTIAQAAFPVLSQSSAKADTPAFRKTLASAINQMLFFILPASVLFIVLRIPIVRLVFGAARFDWEATVLTGVTLSMFSISLFATAISQILTRAFYSLYDSKTPVIIGICTILLNAGLSSLFIIYLHLPIWALATSTTIASILNMGIMYVALHKKIGGLGFVTIGWGPVKMMAAAVVMGIVLFIPLKLLDQLVFDTTRISGLIFLTGISGTAGLTWYVFIAWVLGVPEVQSLFTFLDKFRKQKPVLLEPANEVVNNGN